MNPPNEYGKFQQNQTIYSETQKINLKIKLIAPVHREFSDA